MLADLHCYVSDAEVSVQLQAELVEHPVGV